MTDEEWVAIVWPLWLDDWYTCGTQDRRRELLDSKARIEAATGWGWCPPYRRDNPPRCHRRSKLGETRPLGFRVIGDEGFITPDLSTEA